MTTDDDDPTMRRARALFQLAQAREALKETEAERSRRRRAAARLERGLENRRLAEEHPILRKCDWFECTNQLPHDARPDRRYCSTTCRVRDFRWRRRHPA